MDYLKNNPQYKDIPLSFVRAYFYTGEYTENLIRKVEKQLEKETDNEKLKRLFEDAKRKYEIQNNFIKFSNLIIFLN